MPDTLVNLDQVEEYYGRNFKLLSMMFQHPVIEATDGVWRWKSNKLQRWVLDAEMKSIKRLNNVPFNVDLNAMFLAFYQKVFSLEEYMKWQMDTGYSLSGFGEIFGQRCDANGRDLMTQLIENHEMVLGTIDQDCYNWFNIVTEWKIGEFEGKEYAVLGPTPRLDALYLI